MANLRKESVKSNRSSATSEALSGHSVDDLTGRPSSGKISRNSSITKAYINNAFSFLEADEYNPYKQYSDIDDKNIISLNLDGGDHTKKTALHLTSFGVPAQNTNGGGPSRNHIPKRKSTEKKKLQKKPAPDPAPYITSITVNNNSQYANNIKRATHAPVANNHYKNSSSAAVSEKSKSSLNGSAVQPISLISTGTYETVDGKLSNSKTNESTQFCSKQRLAYSLVIILVCLAIAGLVAGLVYVFVLNRSSSNTDDSTINPIITESNLFNGSLRFRGNWSSDLEDPTSPQYNQIEQTALNQIQQALVGTMYDQKYTANVTGLRPGSIFVLFELLLRDLFATPENILNSLQQGFNNMNNTGGPLSIVDPIVDVIIQAMTPITTTTTTSTSTTVPSTTTSTTASTSSSTSSTVPITATTRPPSTTTSTTSSTTTTSTTTTTTVPTTTPSTTTTSTTTTMPSTTTSTTSTTTTPSTTTTSTTTAPTTTTTTTPAPTTTTTTTTTTTVPTTTTTRGSTVPTTTLNIPPLTRDLPLKASKCVSLNAESLRSACAINGYEMTGNINLMWRVTESIEQAATRVYEFKRIAETGCHPYAMEFLCATYFPRCAGDRQLFYPCRSYCEEFLQNCSYAMNCNFLPKDDSPNRCMLSPFAKTESNSTTIGTPTCIITDTNGFPNKGFICGNNKCVSRQALCDGTDHCGDSSDEMECNPDTDSKLQCNFESRTDPLCRYIQDSGDYFDWVINAGGTKTIGTGPQADHTKRTLQGRYLLAEASGRYFLDTARIISPLVTFSGERCLRFYYHMDGEDVGWLKVKLQLDPSNEEKLIWERHRSAGSSWRYGYVTLPANTGFRLKFEATRSEGHIGDIAIDDISALKGACLPHVCDQGDFQCSQGHCLSKEYVCDHNNDCGDYSDERGCTCSKDEWQCGMGLCIPMYQRCNSIVDCPDLSDEHECGTCDQGRIACPNEARCIQHEWMCDRENDCASGWDESPENCQSCTAGQFMCSDYGCVSSTAQCDGTIDCLDASDEHECIRENTDKVIEVYKDNNFLPLCAANFPKAEMDNICRSFGKGKLDNSAIMTISSSKYAYWSGSQDQQRESSTTLLKDLSVNTTCPDNKVISLKCMELSCGVQSNLPQGFIINGNNVVKGEWPWHAALTYDAKHKCGAVLIGLDHVITAAHCFNTVDLNNLDRLKVVLGGVKYDLSDDVYTKSVSEVKIEPNFVNYYTGDDIAVITLKKPVTVNDYVKPVCLPEKDEIIPLTSRCYAVGFGYTSFYERKVPEILQEVKMRLIPYSKCKKVVQYLKEEMQCAGYESGYQGVCIGDSGGPLICQNEHNRWQLIGVTSFVFPACKTPRLPAVFTKIQPHLTFIQQARDCQYFCANGECLLNKAELCDGKNQCSDYSDELSSICAPTVSCKFETDYICGYSSVGFSTLINSFTRHVGRSSSKIAENNGAIVDKTFGNNTGSYMLSGMDRSVLLSPVIKPMKNSCVTFNYHMRGALTGQLRVFHLPVATAIIHPHQVKSLENMTLKWSLSGNKGDQWFTASVDIPPGRAVIGFEAIAKDASSYAVVSIDDVTFYDDMCNTIACASGSEFTCTQDKQCIPKSQRCNYQAGCIDESDENNCVSTNTYFCDFERYGNCGIEQDNLDTTDWEVLQPLTQDINRPDKDHTIKTNKGHYMYFNMLQGFKTGDSARLKLAIKTPSTRSCLSFYYQMSAKGSFRVTFLTSSDGDDLVFLRTAQVETSWKLVQVTVRPGIRQITFEGVAGSVEQVTGYIAIDDLSIINQACSTNDCHPVDDFLCGSGQCINKGLLCDGRKDCDDNSDESNCQCSSDSFRCDDGLCLQSHVKCNNVENCPDLSDEYGCKACDDPTEYTCDDGTCKLGYTWCDGVVDCRNGEDESPGCQCRPEQFQCDNGKCITGVRACDGYADCRDGSDERPGCKCDDRWHFKCNSTGKCIDKNMRCDLKEQCEDASDESGCVCDSNDHFTCDNGRCIDVFLYCDGLPNCADGSDEPENCQCFEEDFQCVSGGCLYSLYVCDGVLDCFDYSDEKNCPKCTSNPTNYTTCANGVCVARSKLCDNRDDCGDWSDETNCTCKVTDFKCDNGLCVDKGYRCDGNDNCGDESDENQCGCKSGELQCTDGTCYQAEWKCDGYNDCKDKSDENQCGSCGNGQYQCSNYGCIDMATRCDGVKDCPSGSDELGCVKLASNSSMLQALLGDIWLPVCYSTWLPKWSEDICRATGQGSIITTSPFPFTPSASSSEFLSASKQSDKFHSGVLEKVASCKDNQVIKIKCQQKLCGRRLLDDQPTGFIIGGDLAPDGAWPWTGALYYAGQFSCGVVLIDKNFAIAPVHCFSIPSTGHSTVNLAHYYTVQFGTNKLYNDKSLQRQVLKVSAIYLYPNYTNVDNYRSNDIAVIKLASPVVISDYVNTMCLPDDTEDGGSDEYVTDVCYVAGWGFTYRDRQQPASTLREARFIVRSNGTCSSEAYWDDRFDGNTQICAGYPTANIALCLGDSGAPLMCRDGVGGWKLAGINSGGSQQCGYSVRNNHKPAVFTEIRSYVAWIKQIIASAKRR